MFNPQQIEFFLLISAFIVALLLLWGFALAHFLKLDKARIENFSKIAFIVIFVLIGGSLTVRGINLGRVPISNLYESFVMMAGAVAGTYLFLSDRYKLAFLGWSACILILGLLIYAAWLPSAQKEAIPLIPALQSYWRPIHVPPLLVSYAFFALAAITGGAYLFEDRKKESEKSTERLRFYQDAIYRCVTLGFPLLTFGIVTGALWANHAWGNLWQWDPKETLALVTWFCYAAYLHLKVRGQASGRVLAWMTIVGILATYMTYLGINQFDLGGLHSYGKI